MSPQQKVMWEENFLCTQLYTLHPIMYMYTHVQREPTWIHGDGVLTGGGDTKQRSGETEEVHFEN